MRPHISPIWRPMVYTGLSEVIGSWKIMAISLPRMAGVVLGQPQQVAASHMMRPA